MTIALVLGGGAPNLTLMSGAVAALDDAGVEFDIVSTSGAGMLVGLLYAAPKGGDIKRDRAAALKNTVNMGVHDAIYRFFPVNFKVFHKPGTLAQAYIKFWQIAADNREAIEGPVGDFRDQWLKMLSASPLFAPWAEAWKQFLNARTAELPVTITSTFSRTNSAAISAPRSGRPPSQRYSIAMVRPSIQPSLRIRSTKAAVHGLQLDASAPRNPMIGSLPACCARATSGHAAATPPSSVMNSRRLTFAFIRSPRRRGRAALGDFEAEHPGSLYVDDELD